jgi:hypothetical protein
MTDRQGNGHSTNRVGGLSGHSNVFSLVMIVLLVEISAGKMSTKNSPAHTRLAVLKRNPRPAPSGTSARSLEIGDETRNTPK